MDNYKDFNHLILLIGTNPLPNFVVADYFLQNNKIIEKIWLVHSEANKIQAGTDKQTKNVETLLRKRWEEQHQSLGFPLEKISLSDVSDASMIQNEIDRKMIRRWNTSPRFHLNYTGGTKAMAIHVYLHLKALQKRDQNSFSYLDANNFRLVGDNHGIVAADLRKQIHIEFAELIALHDFIRKNEDKPRDLVDAEQTFKRFIEPGKKDDIKDGHWLEAYLASKIREHLEDKKLKYKGSILQNWEIQRSDWGTNFELDIVLIHGYHLTGMSCTKSGKKEAAKLKGFEIIHRSKQIGGDEARAIIVAGLEQPHTSLLQEELQYETGGTQKNILALGLADLRNETHYLSKIEAFVFG